MTTPPIEWTFKRGDDWTASAPIVVSVGGSPQDLTDAGWSVAVQARPSENAAKYVEVEVDEDRLADSEVLLSLPRETTETMAPRVWVVDVQITGPGIGRRSSSTFGLSVVADVTREEEAP